MERSLLSESKFKLIIMVYNRLNTISNSKLGYLVVRIAMGLSLLMHGSVRVPKWAAFSMQTADSFKATILPEAFVYGFASLIIVTEICSGTFLLLGSKFTRIGCALAITMMGLLMFGSAMIENWMAVMNQVVHVIVLYLLLINKHTYDPTTANR